jgi:hypothetical protein
MGNAASVEKERFDAWWYEYQRKWKGARYRDDDAWAAWQAGAAAATSGGASADGRVLVAAAPDATQTSEQDEQESDAHPQGQGADSHHVPTEKQIGKHALRAGDCPPDSRVMLVASIERLQAKDAAIAGQGDDSLPPITGALLRRLFNELEPLAEFETDAEISAWWKHYAGKVRNALRASADAAHREPPKEAV